MNLQSTPEQKAQMLAAEVEDLKDKLLVAQDEIEKLRVQCADFESQITEIIDYSDEEVRDEFLRRGFSDPHEREFRMLAEHIVAGETDDALSIVSELSDGAVSPRVVKMLASARAQESLL